MLHWMMRKTLTPRIDYSETNLVYERNLLDALMKSVCFDVFEYIVDEMEHSHQPSQIMWLCSIHSIDD
jgi:hypothetical protein